MYRAEFDRAAAHLIGLIGDDPPDGSRLGTAEPSCLTEHLHERVKLLFTEIGGSPD